MHDSATGTREFGSTATRRSAKQDLLQRAADLLESLGEAFEADHEGVRSLTRRLEEGRFHLAVLGQFKRGKSTLLNALLGEEVLPTSVLPMTAHPTFVRPGRERRAHVFFHDGVAPRTLTAAGPDDLRAFLSEFVSETANPRNRRGVSHVEVFHPAQLLRSGVVLIDTPGIGSTHRHNTETTRAFLPQCDAALFLVSADPPLTETERDFLQEVQTHVPHLFVVLNKVDTLRPSEQAEAADFLKRVLREAGLRSPRLFRVSAREAQESRTSGDASGWQASGMADVEEYLIDFLATEKSEILQQAVVGKAAASLEEALLRLAIILRSLQMPVEHLKVQLHAFEANIEEAERQRAYAADLLVGDQKRLLSFLDEQANALRLRAQAHLESVAESAMGNEDLVDEVRVRSAIAEAIPPLFKRELAETARIFDQRVAEVLRPHQQRADALIDAVRQQAAELFEIPYSAPESEGAFIAQREPYWVAQNLNTTMLAGAGFLLERLLPVSRRGRRIRRRIRDQIEELALTNMGNLHWATLQNLDLTFRRFRSALDVRLKQTVGAIRAATDVALQRRHSESASIDGDLIRLRRAQAEMAEILARLRSSSGRRNDRPHTHLQKNNDATKDSYSDGPGDP